MQNLQDKGVIKIVDHCPGQFVSGIFLVLRSIRPVVDLRPLNQFMSTAHFKMESLMIKDLLQQGLHRSEGCVPLGLGNFHGWVCFTSFILKVCIVHPESSAVQVKTVMREFD